MPSTQQPTYAIMTLAEWMIQHHDDVEMVVRALCQIFHLDDHDIVQIHIENEIENQARLLLVSDQQGTILGLAGWNWAHVAYPDTELPVYLGVLPNTDVPGIRLLLVEALLQRLQRERRSSDNLWVTTALLQFPPLDRELRRTCLSLGLWRDLRRNESFKASLGANGFLRSVVAPLDEDL